MKENFIRISLFNLFIFKYAYMYITTYSTHIGVLLYMSTCYNYIYMLYHHVYNAQISLNNQFLHQAFLQQLFSKNQQFFRHSQMFLLNTQIEFP